MFEIILSVAFLILDRIYRIYRIEEELSHARLTLHAASALKTRRRQGRGETEHFGLNGSINQQYMALVLWKFANSADENAFLSKRILFSREGGETRRKGE